MSFTVTSPLFLLLLALSPIFIFRPFWLRRILFCVASIIFYFASFKDAMSLIVLVGFIALPYAYISLIIRRNLPSWPIIVALIGAFIYLSGYAWITEPLFGEQAGWKILGLSYILFRQLDIIVNASSGVVKHLTFITYTSYLLSFWTVLAGPIQRFAQFNYALENIKAPVSFKDQLKLMHRATNGLIKVLLIAAFFKNTSDESGYNAIVGGAGSWRILYILYCYPLYVYFNFSGYCDVVIGLGNLAGFIIPENFNRPYLSRNMIEFWNRWHITLSTWVRDYLYQPLLKFLLSSVLEGKATLAQYISIFSTFFIVGVWHGNSINYAVFGLLHGIGMSASLLYRDTAMSSLGKRRFKLYTQNKVVIGLEWFACMHFVCFTFLFFEYDNRVVLNALLNFVHLR